MNDNIPVEYQAQLNHEGDEREPREEIDEYEPELLEEELNEQQNDENHN